MAKRQINFTGPSIQDLGIETEHGNTNIGNSKNGNAKNGTTKKEIKTPEPLEIKKEIGSTNNGTTKKYNTVQFKLIRDYLYAALGNADRIEIKLSVMCQELGINPKTLYKHLKTLRETEFVITKLQYGTEIRKKLQINIT